MKYGYVRANSEEFINAQINLLQNKVDKIIIENNNDNELKKLLEDLQTNDALFICDIERIFRKRKDAKEIVTALLNKNVTLYIQEEKLSLKDLAYAVGIITNLKETDSPYDAICMKIDLSERDKLANRIKNIIKKDKKEGSN